MLKSEYWTVYFWKNYNLFFFFILTGILFKNNEILFKDNCCETMINKGYWEERRDFASFEYFYFLNTDIYGM